MNINPMTTESGFQKLKNKFTGKNNDINEKDNKFSNSNNIVCEFSG